MRNAMQAALTVGTLLSLLLSATPANASYPVKCEKDTVLVVDYDSPDGEDFTTTVFTSIQDAIDAADGNELGSSVGDTVIVCEGTFRENIHVPVADDNGTPDDPSDDTELNANISIRSFKGPNDTVIIGDLSTADAVVDIDANGVHFGGAGLGFTIRAEGVAAGPVVAGIQVGDPMAPDLMTDDDPDVNPLTDCAPTMDPGVVECPDQELPALTPINVTVSGNRIEELVDESFTGTASGISVNNANNTLLFRNRIDDLAVSGDSLAYGIRFADTNSNVNVLQNAVVDIRQSGGTCTGSSLELPTVGAIAMSAEDEALDALFFNNRIDDVEASCTAVGIFSDAWGGLENDRNGQQIPIVTDVSNNRITKVSGAESAGVVLAVADEAERTYGDGNGPDEVAPPSSFRVLTNDIDDVAVAVAVFQQLSMYTYVEQNNFDRSAIGVLNTGNANLDATNNWWGCDEGPFSGRSSCATVVTEAGGTTYVAPWLKHHVDHAGAHAGDHAGHH